MMKFNMTCPCGDVMEVEAATRDAAIEMFKGMMDDAAVAKHFADKHAGQPVPSMDQVHMNISQSVQEVN